MQTSISKNKLEIGEREDNIDNQEVIMKKLKNNMKKEVQSGMNKMNNCNCTTCTKFIDKKLKIESLVEERVNKQMNNLDITDWEERADQYSILEKKEWERIMKDFKCCKQEKPKSKPKPKPKSTGTWQFKEGKSWYAIQTFLVLGFSRMEKENLKTLLYNGFKINFTEMTITNRKKCVFKLRKTNNKSRKKFKFKKKPKIIIKTISFVPLKPLKPTKTSTKTPTKTPPKTSTKTPPAPKKKTKKINQVFIQVKYGKNSTTFIQKLGDRFEQDYEIDSNIIGQDRWNRRCAGDEKFGGENSKKLNRMKKKEQEETSNNKPTISPALLEKIKQQYEKDKANASNNHDRFKIDKIYKQRIKQTNLEKSHKTFSPPSSVFKNHKWEIPKIIIECDKKDFPPLGSTPEVTQQQTIKKKMKKNNYFENQLNKYNYDNIKAHIAHNLSSSCQHFKPKSAAPHIITKHNICPFWAGTRGKNGCSFGDRCFLAHCEVTCPNYIQTGICKRKECKRKECNYDHTFFSIHSNSKESPNAGKMRKIPPANYCCKICRIHGHYIDDCPNKKSRKKPIKPNWKSPMNYFH